MSQDLGWTPTKQQNYTCHMYSERGGLSWFVRNLLQVIPSTTQDIQRRENQHFVLQWLKHLSGSGECYIVSQEKVINDQDKVFQVINKWWNHGLRSKSPNGILFFPNVMWLQILFFPLILLKTGVSIAIFTSWLLIYLSNHFNQDSAYMTPWKLFLFFSKNDLYCQIYQNFSLQFVPLEGWGLENHSLPNHGHIFNCFLSENFKVCFSYLGFYLIWS